MSTTSINDRPHEYRIRERRVAPANYPVIDAIITGDRYPIIRAAAAGEGSDKWLITCGPELSRAISNEFRFPPTLYASSDSDARTWVELLAALYVKAVR